MHETLGHVIFVAGLAHFAILIASALVPIRLNWKDDLATLPRLHRQLFWVYGGYIVLAIVALGLISIVGAAELAAETLLARLVCGYIAVFWGIRLGLQTPSLAERAFVMYTSPKLTPTPNPAHPTDQA